jgi:hypothetical protein
MKPVQTPKLTRYLLRRRIEALQSKTARQPAVRQDRETTEKERELDRALDRAIQEDRT